MRGITRREFVRTAGAASVVSTAQAAAPARLQVPVHRITDARARCTPEQYRDFWSGVWPEAVREFSRAGIDLQTTDGPGEVKRTPSDQPDFVGLRRGVINLVLSGHIPMKWDLARALPGISTIHQGYHVCMIALRYAHGNQVPYMSVNTCVHELLHALLQDIYVSGPKWYQSRERELRIDWCATNLWLFRDGAAVRNSAQAYLLRLRSSVVAQAL